MKCLMIAAMGCPLWLMPVGSTAAPAGHPTADARQPSCDGVEPERVVFLNQPVVGEWRREVLPLGNGRMGCTVFGGIGKERLQFNVDSLWTGNDGAVKGEMGF